MRVSQPVIAVGGFVNINGHRITRTGPTSVTFDFGPTVTSADAANINAAIKPTGITVENYWRWQKVGWSQSKGVSDGHGKRVEAKGRLIVGGGSAPTPVVTSPQPAPISAPSAPVIPQPVPVVATGSEVEDSDVVSAEDESLETASDDDLDNSHRYRPNLDLIDAWDASERGIAAGFLPQSFFFVGPAGSGKTDGAAFLAARSGLDYLKVDTASYIDAEAWFGSKEVISDPQTGSSVTVYHPSEFALALQREGVVYIDEFNRQADRVRQVLLPVIDGTRRVTNPLTGKVLQVHPKCRVLAGGNIGLAYTGTYVIDWALLTRVLTIRFDYLPEADEAEVLVEASGCTERVAKAFARFGAEIRQQSKVLEQQGNSDLNPVATRQLIAAARQVRFGADIDKTAWACFFEIVSGEGGPSSMRQQYLNKWTAIRPLFDEPVPVLRDEDGVPAEAYTEE